MKKTILLTASLALALGGCAEMDTQPVAVAKPAAAKPAAAIAAATPELDKTIADAEQAISAAKKVGIWSETEKFLADAKQSKADGKPDDALKLAKKALKQAQLAEKQALAEAAGGQPNFPK
jgi:hypothetical protein